MLPVSRCGRADRGDAGGAGADRCGSARPLGRVHELFDLQENGCLILVEKVLGESSTCNRLFIEHYYEFKKRNGYSELEIAQKREALENVLIPYRLEENKELLRGQGFSQVDVFFKWYNFCGILAIKS